MKKNLVFGASGLIGLAFHSLIKDKKKYVFYSKTNNKFELINLNNDLNNFPYKDVDKCYFFSSPRIKKNNFTSNAFKLELEWLKKIIKKIKINKLIYMSSSSVYYKKNHVIGSTKLKCEKYIIKNKNLFKNYQIWRPFNLIGNKYDNSDHFHNYLYKIMFLKNKKSHTFSGNSFDKRGYADVNHFVKIMYKKSKIRENFVRNYGNLDLIKVSQIIDLYNIYYQRINNKKFIPMFKSKKSNSNRVRIKKNSVYFNRKSFFLLNSYLKQSLKEKN